MSKHSFRCLFYIGLFPLLSCTQRNQDSVKGEAPSYFHEIREEYGGGTIFNSNITFSIKDLHYTVERKNHIANYTMSRNSEGVKYHTTYKNGHIEYFINDSLQDDKSYNRKFFDSKLDGFVFTTFIPEILTGNDLLIDKLPEVSIRNKNYNVLYIHTKPVEDTPTDRFYLYIDKDTNYIMYLAQDHKLSKPVPVFKRFTNHRKVNSILFADYISFYTPQNQKPLDSLFESFNDLSLKEFETIKYSNITVSFK